MPAARKTTSTRTPKSTGTKPEAATIKKFKNGDQIQCISVTAGKLVMVGQRTGAPYRWLDAGDEIGVDYADLIAEIRARSNYVFKPRFIINDDDFVDQYADIKSLYEKLYSKDDLKQIFRLPADKMRNVINQLPDSVKETVKSLAATYIDNGELDSMRSIKVLDEIFGTQLLLKLT